VSRLISIVISLFEVNFHLLSKVTDLFEEKDFFPSHPHIHT
jgi:hypothetical protein